ncbi:transglycosylase domain-containing protein [Ectobacillus sp. sgz5001026]|uniref:transglycosylase domain-containing protein n=1 Tax=Ectobacillus sp. sgz5001026 TaxID=3242473 RepID=UPI0036D33CB1
MELITNKKPAKIIRVLSTLTITVSFILVVTLSILILAAKIAGPPPIKVMQTSVFYANDDSIIGQSHTGQNRYWASMSDISPYVKDATIAIEDQHFFDHSGFDVKRIAGAAVADIKAMAMVQGASTITQQYARNLYLGHDKTWVRKMMEALYTIRLEVNYSKEQILEGYLNTIYYGNGAYGIEAASRLYFNKHAKDLTLAEASLLAGIPKGPSNYSPYTNLADVTSRQHLILAEMERQGYISKTEEQVASQQKLVFATIQKKEDEIAPYFQDAVLQSLLSDTKLDEQVMRGGLRIYTTLDRNLQQLTEQTVAKTIPSTTALEAAVVVMDPKTGEVKALLGGKDYKQSQFNRATQAYRQPGSTFKPFLYYAALSHGFTAATRLKSEFTTFPLDDGTTYKPSNYNNYYANDFVTMTQALAVSDNVYAVKTHLFLGADTLVQTAKQFGITSELRANPSLALGTSPVKPVEMAGAYSMFANGGKRVTPIFIRRIVGPDGKILYDSHVKEAQVLDPNHVSVMQSLMTGMFNKKLDGYANVTGQGIADRLTRTYAGKSGSTKTDSWMIGFTPSLVTTVWTGYDREKEITNVDEQKYAKEIWAQIMEQGLQDKPKEEFEKPAQIITVDVDPKTGKIVTNGCAPSVSMNFVKGTEPTEYCVEDGKKPDIGKPKPKQEQQWWRKYIPW